jgi:hypothetical protein
MVANCPLIGSETLAQTRKQSFYNTFLLSNSELGQTTVKYVHDFKLDAFLSLSLGRWNTNPDTL